MNDMAQKITTQIESLDPITNKRMILPLKGFLRKPSSTKKGCFLYKVQTTLDPPPPPLGFEQYCSLFYTNFMLPTGLQNSTKSET